MEYLILEIIKYNFKNYLFHFFSTTKKKKRTINFKKFVTIRSDHSINFLKKIKENKKQNTYNGS